MRTLLVSDPRYYQQRSVRPRSFEDWVQMYERKGLGPVGLWRVCTLDKYSGEVQQEQWLENVVTDTGGLGAWKNLVGVSTVNAFNQLVVDTNAGVTTLTTGLVSGSNYTSLAVAALPGSIVSGTSLVIGAGSGTTQTVTVSVTASAGATTITVTSFTANATYAIGINVAPLPSTLDNPSSLGGTTATSGVLTGSQVSFSGSGTGNRNCTIQYTFSTTGSPAAATGNYNQCWLCSAYPVTTTGQTAIHVVFNAPMPVNSTSIGPISLVERL